MIPSENATVLYEERDSVARITLHRPAALHAMNEELLRALAGALERAADRDEVRAVVLTGSGDRAFSAGADIALLHRATPLEVRGLARLAVTVNARIESLGKPVVAAINGHALGGGLELAEACMLRVAARHALLGHPEVKIGAVAGFGGTTRLPRLVGRGRAAELLLTGRLVTAEEALRLGLVNRVVEGERVMEEATRLVEEVLSCAPVAVRLTWEAMHRGLDLPLDASAALGADAFGLVASTEDFRTGTKAFLEKTADRKRRAAAAPNPGPFVVPDPCAACRGEGRTNGRTCRTCRGTGVGRFFHGTKADLKPGDLIEPGHAANFGRPDRRASFVYLTGTVDAATWGAELAAGEGRGRIYVVEPTGPIEDDPNLTDQKFPGNPTRSFRSRDPLRVTGELSDWQGHSPEALQAMKDGLERLKREGVEPVDE